MSDAIDKHLSETSETRLKGVHPDLIKVVRRAFEISEIEFQISEGLRTMAQQRINVAHGASQTLKSRHLDGHAVDVVAFVNGAPRWDWPLYSMIATAFKRAAAELDVPLEWGGSWKTFRDGCHFQLPWHSYQSNNGE